MKVENAGPEGVNNILLDPMDFLRGFSVLKVWHDANQGTTLELTMPITQSTESPCAQ